jgi:hypothetical protein
MHGDAAHGGSYFMSFNYDLIKNKLLTFDDYFQIESEEDKSFIIEQINESIEADGGNIGNVDDIDFSIEDNIISFNLGQIESYAQGLFRAKIEKSKIEKYIRDNYR